MTMNSPWGYKSYDRNWKTPATLIRNLVNISSKGGNYLLNIGPTEEGESPQQSIDGLREIGRWLKVNGEAIYGTQRSPIGQFEWGDCTRKDTEKNTVLYLSVFDWPADGKLYVNMKYDVATASLLNSKTKLKVKKQTNGIMIALPDKATDKIAGVIKVTLKKKLPAYERHSNEAKSFEIVD